MRGGFGSFGQQMQRQMQHQQQQHHQYMMQGGWWMQQRQNRQRLQGLRQQAAEVAGAPRREPFRAPDLGSLRRVSVRSQAAFGSAGSPAAPALANAAPVAATAPRAACPKASHEDESGFFAAFAGLAKLIAFTAAAVVAVAVFPPMIIGLIALAVFMVVRRARRRGKLVGEARQIQLSPEQDGLGAASVLRFRVDRYDNDGNRKAPVAVELRGKSIRGSIQEGDWVEVQGRPRRNSTSGRSASATSPPVSGSGPAGGSVPRSER